MQNRRKGDEEIRRLFSAAKEADRAEAPSFRSVLDRRRGVRRDRVQRLRPRRAVGLALMTAAGGIVLAGVAYWVIDTQFDPKPSQRISIAHRSSARAEEPPEPRATAEAPVTSPSAEIAADLQPLQRVEPPAAAERRLNQQLLQSLGYVGGEPSGALRPPPPPPARRAVPAAGHGRAGADEGGYRRTFTMIVGPFEEGEAAFSGEGYAFKEENRFRTARDHPLSTFSIDVDAASYSNVRRFLAKGQLPPPDAVRIEEWINYFAYDYPEPSGGAPFSTTVEVADCPWNARHRLARIGLKGRSIERSEHGGSNLVFLIDVSGSMRAADKLPLLKRALSLLVDELEADDRVAVVTYADGVDLALPSTPGAAGEEIRSAIERLQAGGSTNGSDGLRLAYEIARESFVSGGINRVVLATDGDFNRGVVSKGPLVRLIEQEARNDIFLTALGFGSGNYKDDTLELLADRGNGNYAYIDGLHEARKVLVEEIGGTLVTIAKDVKIQIEFNPLEVGAYRLIGYENRILSEEEFNDDRKDAGEIGAGHTVTALYELVAPSDVRDLPSVDPLRYREPSAASETAGSGELMTLKIRYKDPEGVESRLLSFPVSDAGLGLREASADFRFASALAAFGMLLGGSDHLGEMTLEDIRRLALEGLGDDVRGHRAGFLDLLDQARPLLAGATPTARPR